MTELTYTKKIKWDQEIESRRVGGCIQYLSLLRQYHKEIPTVAGCKDLIL